MCSNKCSRRHSFIQDDNRFDRLAEAHDTEEFFLITKAFNHENKFYRLTNQFRRLLD